MTQSKEFNIIQKSDRDKPFNYQLQPQYEEKQTKLILFSHHLIYRLFKLFNIKSIIITSRVMQPSSVMNIVASQLNSRSNWTHISIICNPTSRTINYFNKSIKYCNKIFYLIFEGGSDTCILYYETKKFRPGMKFFIHKSAFSPSRKH